MNEKKSHIARLVEPPLTEQGFELADIVLSQFKKNVTVRIFVYGADGVSLDDCARLSRTIGDVLDAAELFPDGYALEVSSPGLDRPLKTQRDFRYRIGETVKVTFADKGRKATRGTIVAVEDGTLELTTDDGAARVPLAEIEQAKIVF